MLFDPSLKHEYYPEELGRAAIKDNSSFVNRTLRDEFYLERKYKTSYSTENTLRYNILSSG